MSIWVPEDTSVSFSIRYFDHHPQVPAWTFRRRATPYHETAPSEPVVAEETLSRLAALVAPRTATLWLDRGAALARILSRLLG